MAHHDKSTKLISHPGGPIALQGLRQIFADSLDTLCNEEEVGQGQHYVVMRIYVQLSTSADQKPNQILDIAVPTRQFWKVERETLLSSGSSQCHDNQETLELLDTIQKVVEDTTGLRRQADEQLWMLDDRISILGARIVKGVLLNWHSVSVVVAGEAAHYTKPTLGWESTINQQSILQSHQHRYFLDADYTIYLKSDDGEVLSTFHVNRFLLSLRIPYFRKMFSSGMADSDTSSSSLYTCTFSAEALTIICRYTYLITDDGLGLFWLCGQLDRSSDENIEFVTKVEEYVYPKPQNSNQKTRTTPCADFFGNNDSAPPSSVITHIIDVIRSADYLGLDDLKSYMVVALTQLGHNFHCYGRGCSMLLPKILNAVYGDTHIPTAVQDMLVKLLGQTKSVQTLWKRQLIMMKPDALEYLVGEIKHRILHDPVAKRTNEGGGTVAAYVLYVALAKLQRQVGAKSKDSTEWEERLLEPLMEFCARVLAGDVSWCEYLVSRGAAGADMDITQGLLTVIVEARFMRRENCEKIWTIVRDRETEFWCEGAMRGAVEWFRKEWLSLSVTPPEPDPRTSARPFASAPHPGVIAPKVPRMKEAYEPNFFATWDRRDLESLGRELDVEVEDLLAQGHRAGLPPRTPRRSVGAEAMKKRGLVRTEVVPEAGSESGPLNVSTRRTVPENGAAVIPPAGGGRTVTTDGATLLYNPPPSPPIPFFENLGLPYGESTPSMPRRGRGVATGSSTVARIPITNRGRGQVNINVRPVVRGRGVGAGSSTTRGSTAPTTTPTTTASSTTSTLRGGRGRGGSSGTTTAAAATTNTHRGRGGGGGRGGGSSGGSGGSGRGGTTTTT